MYIKFNVTSQWDVMEKKYLFLFTSIIVLLMQAHCKYLCHNGELCNSLIKMHAASCARGTPCKFFFFSFHPPTLCSSVWKQQRDPSPLLQLGAAAHATSCSCINKSGRDNYGDGCRCPWLEGRGGFCLICCPCQKISFFLFIPLFFFFLFFLKN